MEHECEIDQLEELTEQISGIAREREKAREELVRLRVLKQQQEALRQRHPELRGGLDDTIRYLADRISDVEGTLKDFAEEVDSIEAQFEDLRDEFSEHQEDDREDFESSALQLAEELRNAKSFVK